MSKPRAYVLTKRTVSDRLDAMLTGLSACGYEASDREPRQPVRAGDLMVTWNRKPASERTAARFEAAGGTVLVAENGYVGVDKTGRQYYALARGAHNGAGHWQSGGPERWRALGVPVRPWRASGDHVLILPNRGIGQAWSKPPDGWARDTARDLARHTGRQIVIRPHPGHWKRLPEHPDVSLARDLADCWAAVTWCSSAGVKALIAGIPVIAMARHWICKSAAGSDLASIESPKMDTEERQAALDRLAYAQWSIAELQMGEAFRVLLAEREREAA
jgi:hypothetical protein